MNLTQKTELLAVLKNINTLEEVTLFGKVLNILTDAMTTNEREVYEAYILKSERMIEQSMQPFRTDIERLRQEDLQHEADLINELNNSEGDE